jgi:hypothetical protein
MAGRGMGIATKGGGAVESGPKNKMVSETRHEDRPRDGWRRGGMMAKKMMAGGGMMKKGYAAGGAVKKKMMAGGGAVRGK